MEYISSDTNVWLDFSIIDYLELPFLLPCVFLMNNDAIENEILSPPKLNQKLLGLGLKGVELSEEEFYLAMSYMSQYRKPSIYDCAALSIAKVRGITLLTGDGPLRKAAVTEGVTVIGTIGILDRLFRESLIQRKIYIDCLQRLEKFNGGKVRLPKQELKERILKCLHEEGRR